MSDDPGADVATAAGAAAGSVAGPVGTAIGAQIGRQAGTSNVPAGGSSIPHGHSLKKRLAFIQQIGDDPNIDSYSKQILMDRLKNHTGAGVANFDVAAEISLAQKGEGQYGVNRKNYELVKQMQDKPGRRQTILSQGAKEVSGTESTGLLTGVPKV